MPTLVSHPDEIKVVSRRFGQGAAKLDRYMELDGYKAVQMALERGTEDGAAWIITEMKASGLRGRGGAGFPTGMKWSFVPKQSEKPKYVLVNGDESEPGTCKDHVLFLHDPHAVIEGTMIAGLAIGAKVGFIYLLRANTATCSRSLKRPSRIAMRRAFSARTSSARRGWTSTSSRRPAPAPMKSAKRAR